MTTLALGFVSEGHTGARMHDRGFLHDQTIAVETGDIAARVGQGNLVDLVGVQPDLALSAFQDGRRQALLQFE